MLIYAGIDEAGYGPIFGPLVVGRAVLAVQEGGWPDQEIGPIAALPLWKRLEQAVCRRPSDRRGRIAVNDSKKLYTPSAGPRHLERGVLTFASLASLQPASTDRWLDLLGERAHRELRGMPWYEPTEQRPWAALPAHLSLGELTIARAMLARAAAAAGVRVLDLGASVVFEDRFNHMVEATRSKAAVCFSFVARHLRAVWDRLGCNAPRVVIDHQGGRMRYRELLSDAFPEARLRILDESPTASTYHLRQVDSDNGRHRREMTLSFEVEADSHHMPVALASMTAKYTRELLMARFQAWFSDLAPQVKPTAGYAADARRFWSQIEPVIHRLGLDPSVLLRQR